MLLQELRLRNIRSYVDEVIQFKRGSTLLAGDIGSGKSSILLAIEFALFGTSRPDLPGEVLLRKGAVSGSVQLSCTINGDAIIIERSLKKEKDSIKQISGFVTRNNIKKELTPVELKAEVLRLLGYPEDLVSKGKNYLFRYTVYTPQEEMKFILQEEPEIRLQVLRRIFNIDKYQQIRENSQLYLKQMRSTIAVLEARTEPLTELQEQRALLEQHHTELQAELANLEPTYQELQKELTKQQNSIASLEYEYKKLQEIQTALTTTNALVGQQEQQITSYLETEREVSQQRHMLQLPQDVNETTLKEMITELEQERTGFVTKQSQLQERLQQIQRMLKERKKEIDELTFPEQLMRDKEKDLQQLKNSIERKLILFEEKKKVEKHAFEVQESVARERMIVEQAQNLKRRIATLDQCPTCLQLVTSAHKHAIGEKENKTIHDATSILEDKSKELERLRTELESVQQKIDGITRDEVEQAQVLAHITLLREKKERRAHKEEAFRTLLEDNNKLVTELGILAREDTLTKLQKRIKEQQDILVVFTQARYLDLQMQTVLDGLHKTRESVQALQAKKAKLEQELQTLRNPGQELEEKRKILFSTMAEEKRISVAKAQLAATATEVGKQIELVRLKVEELAVAKKKVIRFQELQHWMEEHFVPLTVTIEKNMMASIYTLFNQLFQEWFALLIDDENLHARLDDTFTPVIEQNGYEVGFVNLSGGEKTSAALAYRLALNRVINDVVSEIKTKDLLILDEPTDGFSSEQLDKVRDVLERLRLEQIIIVSHEHKIESFVQDVIRVRKDGHVSAVGE